MRRFSLIAASLLGLGLLLWGGAALLGRTWWGDAGWYLPWNDHAEFRFRCGRALLQHQDYDRVEEIALRLAADGAMDYAYLLRGEALVRQARALAEHSQSAEAGPLFVKALTELNRIRDQGSLRRAAATLIGQAHLFLKQPVEAEHALQFVLSEEPDNIEAHRGLAALYHDQGAEGRAIHHLEAVARLDRHDGRPHRLMALIFKDMQQFDQAILSYEEALRRVLPGRNREQHPATVRKELAECLVKQARYQDALVVLAQFEPLPDDEAPVTALRAECAFALNQANQARTLLDQALADHPDSIDLLRMRGKIYLSDNEPGKAVTVLEKALRGDRHDFECRYQLLQAYTKLGKESEAAEQQRMLAQTKKDMEEFAQLYHEISDKPWDATKRLRLAEICERLDKPALAALWRAAADACAQVQLKPAAIEQLKPLPVDAPPVADEK